MNEYVSDNLPKLRHVAELSPEEEEEDEQTRTSMQRIHRRDDQLGIQPPRSTPAALPGIPLTLLTISNTIITSNC
jgi:hypothetical protein